MYMNKTKRNLIISAAVVNLIITAISLILSIIMVTNKELLEIYKEYYLVVSFSYNIVYAVLSFTVGLIGSVLLLYSVRTKGKYFRTSQGIYLAGFIIVILCGGYISWILLFISMFIPDIIIINSKDEIRQEDKQRDQEERAREAAYEDKKKQIEDLKRMRENGLISEEEYKQKLFEIL